MFGIGGLECRKFRTEMLFISFSAIPSIERIELPYVFHIQKDSYKDGDIIDSADDAVISNCRNGLFVFGYGGW